MPLSVSPSQPYSAISNQDAAAVPVTGNRTAVLVIHGMGQQRKFETLTSVVEGIEKMAGPATNQEARNVCIGEERLSRIELQLADGRNIDIYEAYWAPITEGQVKIADVMAFLWGAARNGIANARRPFRRWIFGSHQPLNGGRRTMTYLLIAAAVLASLVFINSLTVALGTAKLMKAGPDWLKDEDGVKLINDITSAILMFLAAAAGFSAAYLAAAHQKIAGSPLTKKLLVSRLGLWYFMGLCVETILLATTIALATGAARKVSFWANAAQLTGLLLVALTVVLLAVSTLTCLIALRRSRSRIADGVMALVSVALIAAVVLLASARGAASPDQIFGNVPSWNAGPVSAALLKVSNRWVAIWIALAWVSARVRGFLVQYLGDVAVYVAPSSLDRFDTLRDRIRDCAYSVTRALYRAADNGAFVYRNVAIFGHSLGSVAAYDCLNRMLNEDTVSGGALRVRERTSGLVTFGSPLDKTAFLFERNVNVNSATRAALAATVQPLIGDPATLSIPWDNVYSPWDIISGGLDFYGQNGANNRVINTIDYDAVTPVGAHTEYWTNTVVWQKLNAILPSLPVAVLPALRNAPPASAMLPIGAPLPQTFAINAGSTLITIS